MKTEDSKKLRNMLTIVGDEAKMILKGQMERIKEIYHKSRPAGTFGSFLVLRGAIVHDYVNGEDSPTVISAIQTNLKNVAVDYGDGNIEYREVDEFLGTEHLISIVEQMELIVKFKDIILEPKD